MKLDGPRLVGLGGEWEHSLHTHKAGLIDMRSPAHRPFHFGHVITFHIQRRTAVQEVSSAFPKMARAIQSACHESDSRAAGEVSPRDGRGCACRKENPPAIPHARHGFPARRKVYHCSDVWP